MSNTSKKSEGGHKAADVGFFAAGAAAAIAGALFLYGKRGVARRKTMRGWMLKAKGEVLRELELMQQISEPLYHKTVRKVLKKYEGLKHVDPQDLQRMMEELKGHWRDISRELRKQVFQSVKSIKKTTGVSGKKRR